MDVNAPKHSAFAFTRYSALPLDSVDSGDSSSAHVDMDKVSSSETPAAETVLAAPDKTKSRRRPLIIILVVVGVVTVLALGLGLGLYYGLRKDDSNNETNGKTDDATQDGAADASSTSLLPTSTFTTSTSATFLSHPPSPSSSKDDAVDDRVTTSTSRPTTTTFTTSLSRSPTSSSSTEHSSDRDTADGDSTSLSPTTTSATSSSHPPNPTSTEHSSDDDTGNDDDDADDDLTGQPIGTLVDLGYAKYQGSQLDNGISEFKGLRFAKAPTGDLRWRAPEDPDDESDIQSAEHAGTACLAISQTPSDDYNEDCLFADVWAPSDATPDSKLPVMVYIQGGGYVTSSPPGYWSGANLVEASDRNIVFVSFNYRIGLYGFLASEDVKNDGDLNAGLLDQRKLFEWVQKHISQFGGDPDHVVIQGASAGAGSVAMHMAAYGGRDDGLFAGVISESTFFPAQPYLSELEWQYERTVSLVGCSDEDNKLDCLRGKTTEELQQANTPGPFPGRSSKPIFYWTPCVDGDFLEDLPSLLYDEGKFLEVPVLAGSCTNEGSLFANRRPVETSGQMMTFIGDNFPGIDRTESYEIRDLYPLEPELPTQDKWFPSASRAFGEATFICPTNNMLNSLASAETSSRSKTPALWSYRYNVEDESNTAKGLGVPHVFNKIAVFGADALPGSALAYSSYNADIVPVVQGYWLSFVRELDPNVHKADAAPTWERWGGDMSRLVIQTDNSTMEDVGEKERERCDYWKSIAEDTKQ